MQTQGPGEQCRSCRHYREPIKRIHSGAYSGQVELIVNCDAFPDGVPYDILTDDFKHDVRHPKQKNDIVFAAVIK
jgi:hypothetical protein